jgi:hypothetical protein
MDDSARADHVHPTLLVEQVADLLATAARRASARRFGEATS